MYNYTNYLILYKLEKLEKVWFIVYKTLITNTVVFFLIIILLKYVTTINLINLALTHKYSTILINFDKKIFKILFIFLKLNILLGWTIVIKKNKIYLNLKINLNFDKKIIKFFKVSKKISFKFNDLKKLKNKFKNLNIFFTTNRGILHLNQLIDKNIGGFLFFAII